MSQVRIATRDSYGKALVELGRAHEEIVVLDADLAESTRTGMFQKEFPERHIDCGIQEANMMGVAAGLAQSGMVPFCSSFAMFAAGRAYEQIRNSIAYPSANVKICATHAGITVGEDGATHQCNEDIALMRTLPGMTIINPGDDVEGRAAVYAAYEMDGPVYLRFGRMAVPVVNDEKTFQFKIGKGTLLKDGNDVTIVATGLMVATALDAYELLEKEGIHPQIVNIHTIKPIDVDLLAECAAKTGKVITVEEHSIIGGLGSAVAEALCERQPAKLRRIGIPDVFGISGPGQELLSYYGLDGKGIAEVTKEFIGA
ncbi:MAG: transketolase family protein [Lachnospiraceae bacterium]|nr:transketolase family protein [Lachnospiraceae bacterium]